MQEATNLPVCLPRVPWVANCVACARKTPTAGSTLASNKDT